jgi:protein Hikeshi
MFGVILPSRPVLGPAAIQTIADNKFAYTFPAAPAFSHLVVFILPDNTLPPDVLAGIYIQFPPREGASDAAAPEFKLLGALSSEKQSAIFRVNTPRTVSHGHGQVVGEIGGVAEVDMDADDTGAGPSSQGGNVTLGISVEPIATLQPQLDALAQQQQAQGTITAAGSAGGAAGTVSTKSLAQKIIKNAFNFLSGFAGADNKVSLKSFEDWWRKFEGRLDSDPSFIERLEGG